MKPFMLIMRVTFVIIMINGASQTLFAQQTEDNKSTQDLSFLIGEWEIKRIYGPGSDNEREYFGTLVCEESLDGQFIKCTYDMKRPGKTRGLDVVYFNYNHIYGYYESVWLASTWPIKGIMQLELSSDPNYSTLNSKGQFRIENDIMEYVKGEMKFEKSGSEMNSFKRETMIRTSEYEEGVWYHHMTETGKRLE